jgi:hypothetical protein
MLAIPLSNVRTIRRSASAEEDDDRVRRADDSFVLYRIGALAQATQILSQFSGKILVNLELHCLWSGIIDSSRARSAA